MPRAGPPPNIPPMMDAFEYLSVLISIILGLGITQLLSGFGSWLAHRATLRFYGPAVAWGLLLLLVHVQTWWAMFGLRHWAEWNFLQFGMVLLQPSLLFLLAVLVFPRPGSPEPDLRANFMAQRRWFFGLFLALLMVSVMKDLIRGGDLPEAANLAFHGVLFVLGSLALATERDGHHRALAGAGMLVIVLYIALLFGRLA